MIPSAEASVQAWGASGHDNGEALKEVAVWRAEFLAPVASFRDPLFPGVTHGLPVPPPSTVRGLLAAATGAVAEAGPVGICAWAEGDGVDAETFHPIRADGSTPAVAGRVPSGKGGMTLRERPFLTQVHLLLWLPGSAGQRIAAALRRPRWPLRLGRSQDIVHPLSVRQETLRPAREAIVGHALAPTWGHQASEANLYRMAASITPDRMTTRLEDYLWCEEPTTGPVPVHEALRDESGQAVWMLNP